MNHNDIFGEIYIPPLNTMSATYSVIGADNSDVLVEFDVTSTSCIYAEISIRVPQSNEMNVELDVKYKNNSDVLVELQPYARNNILAEIEISPSNRMWALYSIQEPPIITSKYYPTKDSFTREKNEYSSINYGGNNSLVVGETSDDIYYSFIEFNFKNWNPLFKIIESKIRLYYSGVISDEVELELYTLDEYWSEFGITNLNKPQPVRLILNKFENNKEKKYIEFTITDLFEKWIEGSEVNNGMMVKLGDESSESLINFRSRESSRSPEIITTYYDTRIYSTGRSNVPIELFVVSVDNSNVLAEIEVGSIINSNTVPTEIYVHRYEDPVFYEIDSELTVTKTNINSEITVSRQSENIVPTELTVRSETNMSFVNTELSVSKPYQFVELYVANKDTIPVEITIQKQENIDRFTEITVTREKIDAEIFVKYQNVIDTEIEVRQLNGSTILSQISVSRPSILSEINVRALGTNEINTELNVRQIDDSDLNTELSVSRDTIYAELIVAKRDNCETETEIFVKYYESIDVEIDVKAVSDILVELDVIKTSNIDTEINISKPIILTEITVPYWDDSDIDAEIMIRVLQVSDVPIELVVRRKAGSYVFMM